MTRLVLLVPTSQYADKRATTGAKKGVGIRRTAACRFLRPPSPCDGTGRTTHYDPTETMKLAAEEPIRAEQDSVGPLVRTMQA
jgi:hypothetical protein